MSVIDDETPRGKRDRLQLQKITLGLAQYLDKKAKLREGGIGFTLILWDTSAYESETGELGSITYASNGNRRHMMRALREMLEKLEIDAQAQSVAFKRRGS